MGSCASTLDFGAISSHGAIGSLESAPQGSITGPIAGYWGQMFGYMKIFFFYPLLINNFLFIDAKDEISWLYDAISYVMPLGAITSNYNKGQTQNIQLS